MTHLQVDPPSYLKTPPLGGTLPPKGTGMNFAPLFAAACCDAVLQAGRDQGG